MLHNNENSLTFIELTYGKHKVHFSTDGDSTIIGIASDFGQGAWRPYCFQEVIAKENISIRIVHFFWTSGNICLR